jgi:dTDP-4-amino-4,6-dideoxygalactose transaminase
MRFIGTTNAIEQVGAKPVFIDCNSETFINIPNIILKKLSRK